MKYKFLDKEYNREDYLKLKEEVKKIINQEVFSTFTSSKNMEALAAKSGNAKPYQYVKGKMVFYIEQSKASDVANYVTSTIIPEIMDNVQEDIVQLDNTKIEFVPSESNIAQSKMEASSTVNPNNVSIRIVPIEADDIKIVKGELSSKVSYSKDPNGKESAEFLPIYEVGVYYKGEMIQSENPNSPSGKTGYQSSRAKHAPRVETAIPAQRMYYRSGGKPATLLYNAALIINNHRGIEYEIFYNDHKSTRHSLGHFFVKPASFREAHVYESNNTIHNYHEHLDITYASVSKYASSIFRTDIIAWNYAYKHIPASLVTRPSTSHQLSNTAAQRADLHMKSEVFTDWLNSEIHNTIKNKVELYSITVDPNTKTATLATPISL